MKNTGKQSNEKKPNKQDINLNQQEKNQSQEEETNEGRKKEKLTRQRKDQTTQQPKYEEIKEAKMEVSDVTHAPTSFRSILPFQLQSSPKKISQTFQKGENTKANKTEKKEQNSFENEPQEKKSEKKKRRKKKTSLHGNERNELQSELNESQNSEQNQTSTPKKKKKKKKKVRDGGGSAGIPSRSPATQNKDQPENSLPPPLRKKKKKKKKKSQSVGEGTVQTKVTKVELTKELVLNRNSSDLKNFLAYLQQNPDQISPTLETFFNAELVSNSPTENLNEYLFLAEEQSGTLLKKSLKLCWMIMTGTENYETRLQHLKKQGIIKSNACVTIWKDGGKRR